MSIYTPTARFDGTARSLSEEEMFKIAPSIFATEPHESRSERFAPIPTIAILREMQKEGFVPVGVKQCGSRNAEKRNFTKHLVRLRKLEDEKEYQVGGTVCEILLKNANDGTSQYDLMAGLWRILCKNSLVAQTGTIDEVKVRHSGNLKAVADNVIKGSFRVLHEAHNALEAPSTWGQLLLPPPVKEAFAEGARVIRFGDADGNVDSPILASQLLNPRRQGDLGQDLWTTFNVVQENTTKGGLSAYRHLGGNRRRVTTKEIHGIDQDIRLNKALWLLAEATAKSLAA